MHVILLYLKHGYQQIHNFLGFSFSQLEPILAIKVVRWENKGISNANHQKKVAYLASQIKKFCTIILSGYFHYRTYLQWLWWWLNICWFKLISRHPSINMILFLVWRSLKLVRFCDYAFSRLKLKRCNSSWTQKSQRLIFRNLEKRL